MANKWYSVALIAMAAAFVIVAVTGYQALVSVSSRVNAVQSQVKVLATGSQGPSNFDALVADSVTADVYNMAGTLHPLGVASDGQEVVCGTSTFTGTLDLTPSGLTSTVHVVGVQRTAPASTAAFVGVGAPSGNTTVISSYGADYGAGTTGVVFDWCALGAR